MGEGGGRWGRGQRFWGAEVSKEATRLFFHSGLGMAWAERTVSFISRGKGFHKAKIF